MGVKMVEKIKEELKGLTIQEKIDLLGKLSDKKNEITKKEKIIKEELLPEIDKVMEGNKYAVRKVIKTDIEIDKEKIKQKLKKDFINVVKVSLTELKKYMTQTEIEECITNIKETSYLKILEIK